MPKLLALGNGTILVCLDKHGLVRDFYFHYAGLENHVSEGLAHKIGIYVDEQFTWIDDGFWNVEVASIGETMASSITVKNEGLGITLHFSDIVYNEKNIFIREVEISNEYDRRRKLKIFFNQQFNISQTSTGDTAYFDPRDNTMIHYKGRRVFLINALSGKKVFDDYSVGIFGVYGKEGTFKDAEDGSLSKNPIEHSQVDSTIAVEVDLDSNKSTTMYYWITVGKSVKKVKELNAYVVEKSPSYVIDSTKDYWKAWVNNQNFSFYGLSDEVVALFKKSLTTIRTHVSKNGSILASGDTDLLKYWRDTYNYVWPRDAAISAIALEKAGDFNASRRFFKFINDVISEDGYFMHKYRPDKSLGSSWHPWIRDGKQELPIQEDGTALVIYALWTHYELSKDLEFIESIYNTLIKPAAKFMVDYRDEKTGLPKPSYDLWEMKFGVHTFTAASVYGALVTASKFANLLGKEESESIYISAAKEVKTAIEKHLYDKKKKTFYKSVFHKEGEIVKDETVDISSVYGVYKFGVYKYDDPILKKAFKVAEEKLGLKTEIGGIARFEGDVYHLKGGNVPGNPWFITTLWLSQYYCEFIKNEQDIAEYVKRFGWVVKYATKSGILSEQIDAFTGEQLSAAPLTWSHAEYVITVIKYLEKLEELGICKACYPVK
jgi:GH15 family glucan-1,4-alpha-glucosidase